RSGSEGPEKADSMAVLSGLLSSRVILVHTSKSASKVSATAVSSLVAKGVQIRETMSATQRPGTIQKAPREHTAKPMPAARAIDVARNKREAEMVKAPV